MAPRDNHSRHCVHKCYVLKVVFALISFLHPVFLDLLHVISNDEKVGFVYSGFSVFANLCLLPLGKTGLIDFAEKQAPTKVKYSLPLCQILGNFIKGNTRKFTVSFAFCARVDVIKYRIDVFHLVHADYLSFRPQCTCDRKNIGSHLNETPAFFSTAMVYLPESHLTFIMFSLSARVCCVRWSKDKVQPFGET